MPPNPSPTKICQYVHLLPGQGIGGKLIQETFHVAKKAECNGIMGMATNVYSRKIFNKLEMEIISEKETKDCTYDGIQPLGIMESQIGTGHFKEI